jgi:hypothetical protein
MYDPIVLVCVYCTVLVQNVPIVLVQYLPIVLLCAHCVCNSDVGPQVVGWALFIHN